MQAESEDTAKEIDEQSVEGLFVEKRIWGFFCIFISVVLCYFWGVNSPVGELGTLIIVGSIAALLILVLLFPSWKLTTIDQTKKQFVKSAYSWTRAIDVAIGHSISFALVWFVFLNGFIEIYPSQLVALLALVVYIMVVPFPMILSRLMKIPLLKTYVLLDYSEQSPSVQSMKIHALDALSKEDNPKAMIELFLQQQNWRTSLSFLD